MITRPAYVTRETLLRSLDVAPSVRANESADRAVCAGSQSVDGFLNRVFFPTIATRKFRWPDRNAQGSGWRLWLDESEIISVTTMTTGGTAVTGALIFLEPQFSGPPYSSIELDLSGSAFFTSAGTPQRSVAVTGVYGYQLNAAPAGALDGAVNASVTTVAVTNSAAVGCGDLLLCGTEYMLVTGSAMVTTGQTLQTPITDASSSDTLAVTTGSEYAVGEVLLLDSERMEITDVAGNNLIVTRAVQGTALASHTGSTIYAPRSLTVTRGAQGSTAASHLDAATLTVQTYPPLASSLALAYAQTQYAEEGGGYARPAGAGGRTQPQPGQGVAALEAQAWADIGRRVYEGAV